MSCSAFDRPLCEHVACNKEFVHAAHRLGLGTGGLGLRAGVASHFNDRVKVVAYRVLDLEQPALTTRR
jgi:hypothetical protein